VQTGLKIRYGSYQIGKRMARLIVLGSSGAVSDADHDHTHFVLKGDLGSVVLVDCGSNPRSKLEQVGISSEDLQDVILTHFHPDHVYGLPILLMELWLLGRTQPLHLYGLHHCLHRVEGLMDAYLWDTWPNFFPVHFHRVSECAGVPVLENDDFRIRAWPTKHFIPTFGLRIEIKTTGTVVGYSCDTEPATEIVELARDVDLLVHEAAGEGFGHSSAAQAGETATQARAKRLALIHYNSWRDTSHSLVEEARTTFAGPVDLAKDFSEYEI
jgi:ribonuclease Z